MRARATCCAPCSPCRAADVLAHLAAAGLAWREDPSQPRPALRAQPRAPRADPVPGIALQPPRARDARAVGGGARGRGGRAGPGGRAAARRARPRTRAARLSRSVLRAAPPRWPRSPSAACWTRPAACATCGAPRGASPRLACVPAASGRRLPLPGGREALVRFDRLVIARASPPPAAFAAPAAGVPGAVDLPDGRILRAEEASARPPAASRAATRSSRAGGRRWRCGRGGRATASARTGATSASSATCSTGACPPTCGPACPWWPREPRRVGPRPARGRPAHGSRRPLVRLRLDARGEHRVKPDARGAVRRPTPSPGAWRQLGAEIGSGLRRPGAVRGRHHEELPGLHGRPHPADARSTTPATSCASTSAARGGARAPCGPTSSTPPRSPTRAATSCCWRTSWTPGSR